MTQKDQPEKPPHRVRKLLNRLAQLNARVWVHYRPRYTAPVLHRYMSISPVTLRQMANGADTTVSGQIGTRHWMQFLFKVGLLDEFVETLEGPLIEGFAGRELDQNYRRYPGANPDPLQRATEQIIHINNFYFRRGDWRYIADVGQDVGISPAQAGYFFNYSDTDKLLGLRFRYTLSWFVLNGVDEDLHAMLDRHEGLVPDIHNALSSYLREPLPERAGINRWEPFAGFSL